MPIYTQNEIQLSPGDTIEIAVCIANLNGIINVDNFKWDKESIYDINKNERDALCYNRDIKIIQMKGDRRTKVHCDINRICEVEDAVPEWITVSS